MVKLVTPKKVFVGLSGGVDSSVSAALLLSRGYDVHGVFIKVWQPDFYECNWREDRLDAMRVCAKLGIPFYTLDLEKEYKKEVVDYMVKEYSEGRTPNPDVMCNKYVKFGAFFDWAMKRGADYVATGHYAQTRENKKTNLHELIAGDDVNKDQSYFLWTLRQRQLAKTLFPVGDIEKPAVRKLAKKFGLPNAEKKDSQGLCFIGKVDLVEFLKHFIKNRTGNVLNEKGEIIGKHNGAILYTIGQRHGFTITKGSSTDSRKFVVSKNLRTNTITVSTNVLKSNSASSKEIKVKKISWTLDQEPDYKKKYLARIRYRQPLEKCKIIKGKTGFIVVFDKTQKAPTAGQSIVFYDSKVCLGGGIIL